MDPTVQTLMQENQALQDEIHRMQERLENTRRASQIFATQMENIDDRLHPDTKMEQISRAYETFMQQNAGYGQSERLSDRHPSEGDAVNAGQILGILHEVHTTLTIGAGTAHKYHVPKANSSYQQFIHSAHALRSSSETFASFLTAYVNQFLDLMIGDIRSQTESSFNPYFAETSDLRQVANAMMNIIRGRILVKEEDMASLAQDLQRAILDIVEALIHVLQESKVRDG